MASAQTKRTVGCLFSGMGGFASGLAKAGFEIRWASDNDSSASALFRHRFPNVTFLEKDVRNLSVGADRLSEVDVLAAGFPCQSFSQAGGRRGLEDPPGRLFFEIPRLLAEFEPARRPRLIILENVKPGVDHVLNRARLYRDRRDFVIKAGDSGMLEDYPGEPAFQRWF